MAVQSRLTRPDMSRVTQRIGSKPMTAQRVAASAQLEQSMKKAKRSPRENFILPSSTTMLVYLIAAAILYLHLNK